MPEVLEKPPELLPAPDAVRRRERALLTNLPNQITVLRFGLSIVLFVLLALCDGASPEVTRQLLYWSFLVFALGTVSDLLDGWLARKLNSCSTFGRMMDPFVDKVMVCGAMVFLCGGTFHQDGKSVTGFAPWMLAVILAREFLVTGVRAYSETQGINFEATFAGKAKMVLQTAVVLWLLPALAAWRRPDGFLEDWAYTVGMVLIVATVAVTVWSGLVYLERARRLLRAE
jgi:CDP-diacylglycerol--glycerol-3-phosphate 3-phosphatidyltransferase